MADNKPMQDGDTGMAYTRCKGSYSPTPSASGYSPTPGKKMFTEPAPGTPKAGQGDVLGHNKNH